MQAQQRDNLNCITRPCKIEQNAGITINTGAHSYSFSRRLRNCINKDTNIVSPPRMLSPTQAAESVLLRQNQELRQRLADETHNYRRRLDTYKQAQLSQAALVSRLQLKIQQYRQRCNDLEERMQESIRPLNVCHGTKLAAGTNTTNQVVCSTGVTLGHSSQACSSTLESPPSLPTCDAGRDCLVHEDSSELCRKLNEEQKKCEMLVAQNNNLRKELEESNQTNKSLTDDLQKLTNDWSTLRDELLTREDEFKDEEQAFKDYYNHEQERILKIWRDVVGMKRTFKDVQSSIKNEITIMGSKVQCASRDVSGILTNVSFNMQQAKRTMEEQLNEVKRENNNLQTQLATLKVQHESARHEILERDQHLLEVMKQMKKLEDRCAEAESQTLLSNRYNDEIDRLNKTIREIAHAIVLDAEMDGRDPITIESSSKADVNISPRPQMQAPCDSTIGSLVKSPRRSGARAACAFAENTISAVQAALNRYQLALHDMQTKLQNANDNLDTSKAQLDRCEETKSLLSSKIQQLTDKLENSNTKLSELLKERDSLYKLLEETRIHKQQVEQSKTELNNAFESLSGNFEKLQFSYGKLQKKVDSLEEDKKAIEIEIQCILKDKNIIEINLRTEEDRGSRLREEIISLREELNRISLAKDLLEQQRIESDSSINLLEKQKADLQYELDKLLLEKCDIQDCYEKIANKATNTTEEFNVTQNKLSQANEECNRLTQLAAEQTSEVTELKKQLSSIEKCRFELETENLSFSEKLKCMQLEKEKLLQDLACAQRDRNDIHNQLTSLCRKKECINEELMRTKQKLEQITETSNRLNRKLEDMIKDVEEKQMTIILRDKEVHHLQELLATLRAEKESLEAVFFDTNTTLQATEDKRLQLEHDLQDTLIREETLKNNSKQMQKDLEQCQRKAQETKNQMTNAIKTIESDLNQKILNLKEKNEEDTVKHIEEMQQLRNSLEKRMQQALQALQSAKDDEIEKLQERLEALNAQMESLIQQHEKALIRAENEKQHALLIAQRDKQSINEKLEAMKRSLLDEQENMERAIREHSVNEENQRSIINQLKEEILDVRTKGEEEKLKMEEHLRKQDMEYNALKEERDNLLSIRDDMKMQIQLKEDKIESLNGEYQNALRKIKESEGHIESLRKELTDIRRNLADSNIERDKYSKTNKELRDHIKRIESGKREQGRLLEESLQKITKLEESKNILENERVRLTTILKETESNLIKAKQELQATTNDLQKVQVEFSQKDDSEKELRNKLTAETELRDRAQQELKQIKKQLADLESNLCGTRQELGRIRCHANQEEHRFHSREQELTLRIEEARCREKRLEDQKHNLEVCLADATQQIQELKARLGGTESRISALDEQLNCLEEHKRDLEHKLASIIRTLKRTAGIQMDGSVHFSHCLLSPSKRYSPVRSTTSGIVGTSCHDYDTRSTSHCPNAAAATIEIDPDLIQKGIRTLMHQVAKIEHEKDDYKMQFITTKKQLQDALDQQKISDMKISKLQQMVRHLQQEKNNLEAEHSIKVTSLNNLEEKLKQKNDDYKQLCDKLAKSELQLAALSEENTQNEEKLEKCRQHGNKLENDKHRLQEELIKIEGKATKLDLQRVALEGDITRLQMVLQEKECNIRQMQERLDNEKKTITQLEERCMCLKTSLDQIKERLQKSCVVEAELRGELKAVQRALSEENRISQMNEDKWKLSQKSLQTEKNDKRILNERLEKSQISLNELRRNLQAQLDTSQRLQDRINDLEVQNSALQSELRIAKWNQESRAIENVIDTTQENKEGELTRQLKTLQCERNDLQNKIQVLQDKIKELENNRISKFSDDHVVYDQAEKLTTPTTSAKSVQHQSATETNSFKISSQLINDNQYKKKRSIFNCGLDHVLIEQENRDLRLKVRRLETLLAEKESELARCKARIYDSTKCGGDCEPDRYHSAHLHAERFLDAREQAHRQQVTRLENQISLLREQLAQETKRRQQYILRSSRANREMQHLRNTLGDSLRHVTQHPLDSNLLESETKRLDNAVTMSLPPPTYRDYEHD